MIEINNGSGWQEIAAHTGIGHQRIIRLQQAVSTQQIRLRIASAAASPVLSAFNLYLLPEVVEEPYISRNAEGMVELVRATENSEVLYSIDDSAPSIPYSKPILLAQGGTVKAQAILGAAKSAITTSEFDVSTINWQVLAPTDKQAKILIQEHRGWDIPTYSGAAGRPIEIIIDLASQYELKGFTLRPASQNPYNAGPPARYQAWVSDDANRWGETAASGEFSNIAANRGQQRIKFPQAHKGRYLKLKLPQAVGELEQIAVSGIGIITR